jgi:hypothetical protein
MRATQMWAMLPFRVLVCRGVGAAVEGDLTVSASDLLATLVEAPALGGASTLAEAATLDETPGLAGLTRRDRQWHWPLPPVGVPAVERVPVAEVLRVAQAASRTMRAAAAEGVAGRAIGERALRDALLDHVPILVSGPAGEHVGVPQRVVQALVRMGFVQSGGPDPTHSETSVTVRSSRAWIGLDGSYGSAWFRATSPLHLS